MSLGQVLRICIGVFFILLGITGLFLPFLQGILLILLGVLVLKADSLGDVWHIIRKKLKRS